LLCSTFGLVIDFAAGLDSSETWLLDSLPQHGKMLYTAILSWTLLLSFSTALSISSHLATETAVQCSTIYDTASAASPLSTSTAASQYTIELSPVILHNYTTSTITYTPKPFETLFSVLATKTKTVEREAINGTLFITKTKFGTSTFWNHVTVTNTVTKQRLLTSKTTTWVSAPTGFVGVRNGSSAVEELKRDAKRSSSSTRKAQLQKPTKGKFAVAVECQQQLRVHTTETLLLTARNTATVTAKQETVFKNRTVYGTVTSTIMALSSSNATSIPSVSGSGSGFSSTTSAPSNTKMDEGHSIPTSISPTPSSPTLSLQQNPVKITTNITTITKTPYTISFTWTSTSTSTTTKTLHATTTITSYAACASGNLLSQTSNNQRINGVSFGDDEQGEGGMATKMESVETDTAALCCETCIQMQNCLWSIYEASGERQGSCYLVLANSSAQKSKIEDKAKTEGKKAGGKDVREEKQAETCSTQQQKGTFGYTARNGEVRYVVSNGPCGLLLEA
jgi:hypothetical protein